MLPNIVVVMSGLLAMSGQQGLRQPSVNPVAPPEAGRVAAGSLKTLGKLLNDVNAERMGFKSTAEVQNAVLGAPLVSFFLQVEDLLKYEAGVDPLSLLRGGDLVVYPVLVGSEPRCLVEVRRGPKGWAVSRFGGAPIARLLYKYTAEQKADATESHWPSFEIRIAAFQAHFLAVTRASALRLIPLSDHPDLIWHAGESVPLRDAFAQLSKDAKDYRALTR